MHNARTRTKPKLIVELIGRFVSADHISVLSSLDRLFKDETHTLNPFELARMKE